MKKDVVIIWLVLVGALFGVSKLLNWSMIYVTILIIAGLVFFGGYMAYKQIKKKKR